VARYDPAADMIRCFACRKTARFFEERKTRSFPPDVQRVALRKLAQLHAVTELIQLAVCRSVFRCFSVSVIR
jgi:plasmid maintenance system killer protein